MEEQARLLAELQKTASPAVPAPASLVATASKDKTKNEKSNGVVFGGDVRIRYEAFNGGTLDTARNRERYRLRLNAIAKLSDDWSAGVTLASGDVANQLSANQTLTGFFARKPIAIDKAFVQFTPSRLKLLTITGGKFAYTWYRTEMVFDDDLSPEGLSES